MIEIRNRTSQVITISNTKLRPYSTCKVNISITDEIKILSKLGYISFKVIEDKAPAVRASRRSSRKSEIISTDNVIDTQENNNE